MLADSSTSITFVAEARATSAHRDDGQPGGWSRMTAWSRWVRTSAARIRQHARCARAARSMRADLLSSFALVLAQVSSNRLAVLRPSPRSSLRARARSPPAEQLNAEVRGPSPLVFAVRARDSPGPSQRRPDGCRTAPRTPVSRARTSAHQSPYSHPASCTVVVRRAQSADPTHMRVRRPQSR